MGVLYGDSQPLVMDDYFYCCVIEDVFSTNHNHRCRTTGVLNCTDGTGIGHREGIDTVRGFTVGNTDPLDPAHFDLLLVFTVKATWNDREWVQASRGGFFRQVSVDVLDNQPLAVDLLPKYGAHGLDGDTDHVWIDDTGLYKWILWEASACPCTVTRLVSCSTGLFQYATVPEQDWTAEPFLGIRWAPEVASTRVLLDISRVGPCLEGGEGGVNGRSGMARSQQNLVCMLAECQSERNTSSQVARKSTHNLSSVPV